MATPESRAEFHILSEKAKALQEPVWGAFKCRESVTFASSPPLRPASADGEEKFFLVQCNGTRLVASALKMRTGVAVK